MSNWYPWHGCRKISDGCKNCYVYRQDSVFGKSSSDISKNSDFDLPLRLDKYHNYKLKNGKDNYVATCMTSDFFIEEADKWRNDIWKMVKQRCDLNFFIITKRIDRFLKCIPSDWGKGYKNVIVACTIESQSMADYRLPIYLKLPILKKVIVCAPLLERINLRKYLNPSIINVGVGGESGKYARVCDYEWVLDIRNQCLEYNIDFYFKQTGSYLKKDRRVYNIPKYLQTIQAKNAGINILNNYPMFESNTGAEEIRWF